MISPYDAEYFYKNAGNLFAILILIILDKLSRSESN